MYVFRITENYAVDRLSSRLVYFQHSLRYLLLWECWGEDVVSCCELICAYYKWIYKLFFYKLISISTTYYNATTKQLQIVYFSTLLGSSYDVLARHLTFVLCSLVTSYFRRL